MRIQRYQGESYNSRSHVPTGLHTRSYTSTWIWQAHVKSNKLYEGVRWSHTKDFFYVQAWSQTIFNKNISPIFRLNTKYTQGKESFIFSYIYGVLKKTETFIFNYFIMTSFTTFLLNEWITLACLINYRKGKMDVKLLQSISLKVISI